MAQIWIGADTRTQPHSPGVSSRFSPTLFREDPEFKTDLDLERLPSGKFDTNYLVCQLAALAMNILRLIGQNGLLSKDAPVRHEAKRRRLKTVMQELIYRAGRLIQTGRRIILGLGAHDRAAKAFMRLHEQFAATQ